MTEPNFTEAGTVQFPMVRHAAEVGWTPLPPKDALAMRGGEAGLLFQDELGRALRRFNPWMSNNAIRSVVENLQALPPTIEGNRQMLAWLRKFEGIEKDASLRDNVFVFIDEAHRSVARELGTYLMAALPNSTIVGFTGTPIARTEHGEGTFKIFGADDDQGYLDKYSIAESIEDETTVPIRHMMAPSEMTVPDAIHRHGTLVSRDLTDKLARNEE